MGSKWRGRRLAFRKRKLNFYSVCTMMCQLSLFWLQVTANPVQTGLNRGGVDSKVWGVSLAHIIEKSSEQLGLGLAWCPRMPLLETQIALSVGQASNFDLVRSSWRQT